MADDAPAQPIRRAEPPDRLPATVPATGPGADGAVMTLVDHLTELRRRLFRAILGIVVGSAIGFYFAEHVITFLAEPAPGRLLNLAPGDAFAIYLRVSIVIGIILAMPVILYQVWAFVAPGLTDRERKVVRPWVPLALLFFALGVAIAWVVFPFALDFLLSFGRGVFANELSATGYFNFITTMFLAFGLVMEFPILLFGLSRVGIVTSARLRAARRYVILGIAIFAAVVTPGGDLVSPFALGGTMYLLFEGTAFVIARTGR
jgi:sec-independent protein translocase protein TatC